MQETTINIKNSKKKKILITIVASLLGISLITFIALSIYIGVQSSNGFLLQNKDRDTREASYMQLKEWNYDYTRFEFLYPKHTFNLKDTDGYKIPMVLFGRYTLQKSPTVILVHGLGGDHVHTYPLAEIYLQKGWNVLALDQRGSGQSQDPVISFGYNEQKDLKTIVDYIKTELPKEKIYIHGLSMGAATTGLYAGTPHANEFVDGIILDSSYDVLNDLFYDIWQDMDSNIPADYALFCTNLVTRIKYGFTFDDINVSKNAKLCTIPTLIIGNKEDSVCPIYMSENIYNSLKTKNKTLWITECKHVEGIIKEKETYIKKVLEFVQ